MYDEKITALVRSSSKQKQKTTYILLSMPAKIALQCEHQDPYFLIIAHAREVVLLKTSYERGLLGGLWNPPAYCKLN